MAIDYYHRGDAAFHAGNKAEALKAFAAGLVVEPTHLWCLFMLGEARFWFESSTPQDLAAAVIAYSGCIGNWPDYLLPYLRRAQVNIRLEQFEDAVRDCNKVIELNPDLQVTWSWRGRAYEKLGRWESALADYAVAIARDQRTPLANLGLDLIQSREWDKAIALFSKVIDRNPKWIGGFSARAECHGKLGQWDKAIADLTQVIAIEPKDFPARNSRALAYSRLRQWKEAIVDFTEALSLFPSNTTALENRARAYASFGRQDLALADRSYVLKLIGTSPQAMSNLALALANHADPDARDPVRAMKLAQKAVDAAPATKKFWITMGIARYRADQWQEALDAFAAADNKTNISPDGWELLFAAMSHWKLDQKDQARKMFGQGVNWMNANAHLTTEELDAIRAEAAQLLGITEQPKEKK